MGANLAEVLLAAAGDPAREMRPALREPGRIVTLGALASRTARVAGALRSLGVDRGDRVAILMPDGADTVAAILGAIRLGAVAVPLSELARPNDLRALIVDAEPRVAIVHTALEPALDEVRPDLPSLRDVIVVGGAHAGERSFEQLIAQAEPAPAATVRPDDPAFLLYSAGTDGRPRGVPHTHAAPVAAFRAIGQGILALSESDRVLTTVKLTTAYGFGAGLVFPLLSGAQAWLLPAQAKSELVLESVRLFQPTVVFGTPSLYGQLATDVAPGAPPLACARALVAGAEALPATLAAHIEARLGAPVLPGYGLTEALSFVLATPPGEARAGSSGRPVPGYKVRVVGDDGAQVGPSEIGTLEISGPTVARGYWNQPDESKRTFVDGWLRTNDRFLVDADGWFFHCGRADELLRVGGKWVATGEVEQTLLRHEAVWECAVVGAPDEHGLEKPFAFVVPNVGHAPGPELERALIEFVKRELAPFKYPRWIEFVDTLPKGPTGKLQRYKLRPRKRRAGTAPPIA